MSTEGSAGHRTGGRRRRDPQRVGRRAGPVAASAPAVTPLCFGRFPCSAEGARRARRLVIDFAKSRLFGEDLVSFELAAGEAVANCVEHGGGPTLTVKCWVEDGRLFAEIRHRGEGFEPPERVEAPPRGAPRGYGLFIMHEVLDGVEFLEGGTGLRLIKQLPDPA
ncbi:MAG TPA: ATP-binding protein [Candidatus Cybelea sp.]|nr:ATP-binding protein [Candidatus Cybelea sp.]